MQEIEELERDEAYVLAEIFREEQNNIDIRNMQLNGYDVSKFVKKGTKKESLEDGEAKIYKGVFDKVLKR